ncbi:MAG: putative membrane protein [Gammaproteobacteria bacterium]|jgi:uncharacterized membrane protein
MKRFFGRPVGIPALLFVLSGLTIAFAAVEAVQILLGSLPEETMRLAAAPYSLFAHTVAGATYGVIGPLQFGRVLARKFGRLHRIMGRIFVGAGVFLSLSSLSLLWQFPDGATAFVSSARLVFGIALGVALIKAMVAIRARDIARHRDWMIRAYAVGMGAAMVSIVFIPIYIITGKPPMGITSDIAFVGSWLACIGFAEWVIYRLHRKAQPVIA